MALSPYGLKLPLLYKPIQPKWLTDSWAASKNPSPQIFQTTLQSRQSHIHIHVIAVGEKDKAAPLSCLLVSIFNLPHL